MLKIFVKLIVLLYIIENIVCIRNITLLRFDGKILKKIWERNEKWIQMC